MSSQERAGKILERLSQSIQRERLIPQDLEAEVIQLFTHLRGDEMVTAVLHTRYLYALDILLSTQDPQALADSESLTSVEVSQAFLEATVLLAAGIEAKIMGDAEVAAFLTTLMGHHMRYHFLNAASDHFGWSHSNFLWDTLTDVLLPN